MCPGFCWQSLAAQSRTSSLLVSRSEQGAHGSELKEAEQSCLRVWDWTACIGHSPSQCPRAVHVAPGDKDVTIACRPRDTDGLVEPLLPPSAWTCTGAILPSSRVSSGSWCLQNLATFSQMMLGGGWGQGPPGADSRVAERAPCLAVGMGHHLDPRPALPTESGQPQGLAWCSPNTQREAQEHLQGQEGPRKGSSQ